MVTNTLFVLALISCAFAGFQSCYNPDTTIYNEGISGTPYPGKLCTPHGCLDTQNHQIFYCYNFLLDVIVPCNNYTWDPISNNCGLMEVANPGCTTKECVDLTRMLVLDTSQLWGMC